MGEYVTYRSMTFTCTASDCGHRSTHEFSRRSYEKGIVLVQCPSCKNRCVPFPYLKRLSPTICRHLVADHLGWFNVCPPAQLVDESVLMAVGRDGGWQEPDGRGPVTSEGRDYTEGTGQYRGGCRVGWIGVRDVRCSGSRLTCLKRELIIEVALNCQTSLTVSRSRV